MTFVSVDVPNGEHRTAAYLAKNPSDTIPALELHDGTVISECTAITEYIDHTFDGSSLTGESPKDRAVIHHATPGLGPAIETYQNADWGQQQKEVALAGMRYFNEVLGAQPFVAGKAFSMADITVCAGLGFAGFAKIEIPASCPELTARQTRMSQRPSMAG